MQQSENINDLATALAAFQANVPQIENTETVRGKTYSFKYAPLGELLEATRPLLASNGLSVSQILSGEGLTTTLMHVSGQWICGTVPLVPYKGHQDFGKSVTYARRYAYQAILGIVGEDDISETELDGEPQRQAPQKKAPPQKKAHKQDDPATRVGKAVKGFGWKMPDFMAHYKTWEGFPEKLTDLTQPQADATVRWLQENQK